MAIEHRLWGAINQPWGYAIRCDLTLENGRVFHQILTWWDQHEPPSVPQIAARVIEAKQGLVEWLVQERIEYLRTLRAARNEAMARRDQAAAEWRALRETLTLEGEDPDGD